MSETETIPTAAVTPAAETAVQTPAVEAVVEPAFAPHTETPSLLETVLETPAVVEDVAKPAEPVAPEPAPLRTYEAFTLPEGITAAPEQLTAFQEIAAKHNLDQEAAQNLINMHAGAITQYAEHLAQEQHRVFADTRKQWQAQIKGDPELGGAGFETTMKAVARMRDKLVPASHADEFNQFLRVTGAGDHPAFFRLMHNAARYFDEPAAPAVVAAPLKNPSGSKGRGLIYDHPTSQKIANR